MFRRALAKFLFYTFQEQSLLVKRLRKKRENVEK